LGAERFRSAFHGDHAAVYEELAVALLDRDGDADIAEAFAVCERAKSRTLQELMRAELQSGAHTSETSHHDDAEASLVQRLDAARAELNALYSVLDDDCRNSPARQEQWRRDVRRREEEVAELDARLATTAANGGLASVFAPTVNASAAQRVLSECAGIIEYFTAGDEIIAFIIGRDSLKVHRNAGSIQKVAALSQSLQFQISRALRPGALDGQRGDRLTIDALRVLTELAAELVQPLASDIASFDELTIVPHGILHALPFHAMPLDGLPLIETHRMSTAPSSSVLASIASAKAHRSFADAHAKPLVVGVADEIAPDIEREAALVAATLGLDGENLLTGAAATVQAVSAKARNASLLHLACHGRLAPESPMGSGLRLADRWLTLRKLMDWRLQAALVTLSGCETGLHRVKPGDDLIGLQRGFFAAGAKAVLSTLWRVDDATTSEYMAAFYGFLNTLDAGAGNVAGAFRNAVVTIKRTHPHPAFW
ncbi:MAG TPA: CHAT domain-containing protein, partial [Roseiflexaceae bacterium]|nr:CHAT domain-containing protein [Roseiflexaceae bacterium]